MDPPGNPSVPGPERRKKHNRWPTGQERARNRSYGLRYLHPVIPFYPSVLLAGTTLPRRRANGSRALFPAHVHPISSRVAARPARGPGQPRAQNQRGRAGPRPRNAHRLGPRRGAGREHHRRLPPVCGRRRPAPPRFPAPARRPQHSGHPLHPRRLRQRPHCGRPGFYPFSCPAQVGGRLLRHHRAQHPPAGPEPGQYPRRDAGTVSPGRG